MAKGKSYGDQNGKNPTPSALDRMRARRSGADSPSGHADYSTVTPGWVMAAIIAVTKNGGAIQFGYSRDGGVYSIVILMNGEIEKNYVKQSEGLDQFLEDIYTSFTPDG